MPKETLLQQALRRIYRAPDGIKVDKYNGSIFEPSSIFAPVEEEATSVSSRTPATPAQIQAVIDQGKQSS